MLNKRRILIGCCGVPGYGGASTLRYKLFARMLADGHDVTFLNIITEQDRPCLKLAFGEDFGNPHRLEHVVSSTIENNAPVCHESLAAVIREISPDILIGGGHIASVLLKLAAPGIPLVFTAGGSPLAAKALEMNRLREFLDYKLNPPPASSFELKAMSLADLVITHSPAIQGLFERYYAQFSPKLHPNVLWLGAPTRHEALRYLNLKLEKDRRDIDLVFIASLWDRSVKNWPMVKEIIAGLPQLNIHVIGEAEEQFGHAVYHGLLSRREDVYALLGRSKTLACPSLFDAAPEIVFEAFEMDCRVVASKTCGNSIFCNEELIVEDPRAEIYLEKILLSLSETLPDRYDEALSEKSYAELIETLDAFLK